MPTNNRYNPSAQRRPQQLEHSTRRRPSAQRRDRPLSPTASKAGALKLSREKTASRKHQRPWTLKEWEFVETIPKDIDEEGIKAAMYEFQDKFKWTPTEGQLRSQYWYFKKSARKMREFLTVMQRMRGRDGGAKTEAQVVSKMKTGTLRPTW